MSIGDVRQMLGDREMLNKLTNMRVRAFGQHNSEIPQKITQDLVVADVLRSLDTRFSKCNISTKCQKYFQIVLACVENKCGTTVIINGHFWKHLEKCWKIYASCKEDNIGSK